MKLPWLGRLAPVRLGIAVKPFRTTDQLRFAIPVDVGECGRLVVRLVEHHMLRPKDFAALRVFIPGRFLTGKTNDQNVIPAIAIEIISKSKEII